MKYVFFMAVEKGHNTVDYRDKKEENSRWLKSAFQTKIQWFVLPSFLKWCGFHTQGQNEACG